jgi:hypothetical protein
MILVQENIMNILLNQYVFIKKILFIRLVLFQLFLSDNENKKFSITAEQLHFVDNGYFETFSLAWLEHAIKVSENKFYRN